MDLVIAEHCFVTSSMFWSVQGSGGGAGGGGPEEELPVVPDKVEQVRESTR